MSNIEKIEPIKVNGSSRIYGGDIYFCSVSLKFNEAPNEVQINVVNDNGRYNPPNVNLSEKKDIEIGKLKLGKMVAYKYRERFSSQGKILEVYFIDGSYILDKIFVGLIGKHAWSQDYKNQIQRFNEKPFTEIIGIRKFNDEKGKEEEEKTTKVHEKVNANFYIIGRQFHPCDINKDNLIDFKEATNFDFCDPCPSCPEDKFENRCQELSYMQIFDVGYSLQDLEDALKADPISLDGFEIEVNFQGIPSQGGANKNPKKFFYRDHFGPMREVLNSWANDFGCVWFLENKNDKNTIQFIDISSREIEINPESIISQYRDSLVSYEKEATAENTAQRGNISWYERAGEKKDYSCSKATTVILSALYGTDFIGNKDRETVKGLKYNSNFYMMGGILKAYNPTLRNIWWIRNVYEITNPTTAAEYITSIEEILKKQNSSSSSSEDEEVPKIDNKIIYEMGNMRILSVITKEPINGNSEFHNVAKNQYNNLKNTMNSYERLRFEQKSGYFIVAYIDDKALQQIYDLEDELYDFAGKFYVREHMFRLCGITGNDEFVRNNTNIESADGSAQIYSKKDGIGTNPLSKFKYYKSGYLGCIMGKGNLSNAPVAKPSKNLKSTQGFQIKNYNGNNVLSDTPEAYSKQENIAGTLFSIKSSEQHVPKLEQTAIILERQAKWVPEPELFQSLYNSYITEKYADYDFKVLGSDGIPSSSKWIINALGQNTGFLASGYGGNIKVFIAYQGNLEIKPCKQGWTKTISHPTDELAAKTRKVVKRIGGKFAPETPIGLLNNRCHTIEFGDNFLGKIITPPHTFIPKDAGQERLIEPNSQTSNGKPCDSVLNRETFRIPAYRVYVSQSFNQTVTLPKIQSGAYSNMECSPQVRSFEVNYLNLSDDDFFAFTGSGAHYGCIPNVYKINEIHSAYTGTSYSNLNVDYGVVVQSKKVPEINDISSEIKRGLSNLEIQLSENGILSTITYNTKLIKSISSDLLKFKNTRSFGNVARGNV